MKCPKCGTYIQTEDYITPAVDKARMKELFYSNQRLMDFLEFLFDHSEHCDHISQQDAFKEFEEWEKNNYTTKNQQQP